MRIMGAASVFFAVWLGAAGWASAGEEIRPPQSDITELSLEELMNVEVSGASKYQQKQSVAPSSVSVITAEDIKKFGYRTLADILRSVRGFYISYDRSYSYVGVRGFSRPQDYNSRILLVVDGHRLNDNIYDSVLAGTEGVIDVDLIDHIEIIRGPGSSLYGSNAFLAVLNIITRREKDVKGVEISGEAASFNTRRGRVTAGSRLSNGFEGILSGSAYDSKGQDLYFKEFDNPATNNGVFAGGDYDRYQNAFMKTSYGDFTIEGDYNARTKGIPTASYGMDFNDPRSKTLDRRSYLDVSYKRSLGSKWDLTARVYYDYYKYVGDYVYSNVINKDIGIGQWWGTEVRTTTTVFNGHKIVAGIEYTGHFQQDMLYYDQDPYYSWLDERRRSWTSAVYIQDEFSIGKDLRVYAGARYDHYSTFGGTTNPRFAVIYAPDVKASLKFLFGRAFRAPNAFELYWFIPGSWDPNPDLKPETIKTYEVVYERMLKDGYRFSVGGFFYEIDNLISQAGIAPPYHFENLDKADARGIELELERRFTGGAEGRLSYTVEKVENSVTNETLTNAPSHLAKANLVLPLMKKLFVGLEEQYTSRRKTLLGDYTGSFWITNITLFSRQFVDRLELSASVYNLFDKNYGDPTSGDFVQTVIPQDGRNYRVKLTYVF